MFLFAFCSSAQPSRRTSPLSLSPSQVRDTGIWTQQFPEPSASKVPRSKRSTSLLETLVQLLELPFPADAHSTVCELAAGLCWNMCARDRALSALFAQHLGPFALRRIAGNQSAPPQLRAIAMGQLLSAPLEDPRVLDPVLVSFVYSGSELLETVGARGIAFLTQTGDRHGKVALAHAGAVTALCALLRKQLNGGVRDDRPDEEGDTVAERAAAGPEREADLTGVSEEGHLVRRKGGWAEEGGGRKRGRGTEAGMRRASLRCNKGFCSQHLLC